MKQLCREVAWVKQYAILLQPIGTTCAGDTYLRYNCFASRCYSGNVAERREDDVLEHKFPLSKPARNVKVLSLSSTALAFASSPFLAAYPGAGVGLAASFCLFGMFTTGLLHWFTAPYIHHLRYSYRSRELEASQLTILGTKRVSRFSLADISYADTLQPLTTFAVGRRIYYVDPTGFPDPELLAQLTPSPPMPSEPYQAPLEFSDDEEEHPPAQGGSRA